MDINDFVLESYYSWRLFSSFEKVTCKLEGNDKPWNQADVSKSWMLDLNHDDNGEIWKKDGVSSGTIYYYY